MLTETIILTAGARYDWYELTDNKDQDFDSNGFSPNVGINYNALEGWTYLLVMRKRSVVNKSKNCLLSITAKMTQIVNLKKHAT